MSAEVHIYQFDTVVIDLRAGRVTVAGREVALTACRALARA
jgi:hypothetical protein